MNFTPNTPEPPVFSYRPSSTVTERDCIDCGKRILSVDGMTVCATCWNERIREALR